MANTSTSPTTEREHYLASFAREAQTTLRVLKAFPADKTAWKPSDRSPTVTPIAWMLVVSQWVTEPIMLAPRLEPQAPPPAPDDWNTLVATFETAHRDALVRLTAMSDATYNSTIVIPVGPNGATAPVRRADALWMMLSDTVHHRGQFSVYLRASGAKVPSIYGPSGDEPWF
jgi:uncharacterized damage-inducible protein DinB